MPHPLATNLREVAPKCSAFAAACPATIRQAADIIDAAYELLEAPHHDHFAARLGDEELAAVEKLKGLLLDGGTTR